MIRFLPRAAAGALALIATPAAAEWREASTDHFLIYADADEAWTRGFAEKLERFDAAMRMLRTIPPSPGGRSNRVIVYVLPDVGAVQDMLGRSNVAGVYLPRVGNSISFVARDSNQSRSALNGEAILFHEYSHHLMWSGATVSYPMWLSEGFAEFNATVEMSPGGRVQFGHPPGYRARSMFSAQPLSMPQMFDPPRYLNWDLFYGQSWLLVHMLTFDPARAGQLGRYEQLLGKEKPTAETARAAFGDLKKLGRDLAAYTGRPLAVRSVTVDPAKLGKIELRALGAGEAAVMEVRMRSARGVDEAAAKRVLAVARRRAAPFPNDPVVQGALAEAEYDAGNDAEADAAADRALAADPKSQQALIHKGLVATRIATKAKATDAATWKAVRGWYIRAVAADPDAARPLSLFYQTYAAQGIAPTANAAAALYKAFQLSPQDRGLRMRTAHQLLREGKLADARTALVPLAFDPHSRGESNFAAKLVTMIDAGEPADTIAAAKPDKPEKSDAESSDKRK